MSPVRFVLTRQPTRPRNTAPTRRVWDTIRSAGNLMLPIVACAFQPRSSRTLFWLYDCFSLSLREVELILAARGVMVSDEPIRE
jgi:hypothetical protein